MRAIYSYNKVGFEERYWSKELDFRSGDDVIIPFNHGRHFDISRIGRAQLLDNIFFAKDPQLLGLYQRLEALLTQSEADCLIVDNQFPYHPEFLRTLPVYKVLRTSDGPLAAYDRDFAYLHAYHHVLFHSPAYSPELTMAEKLRYVGAARVDFWPLALFDAMFDPDKTEEDLFAQERDIDVIFVGSLFPNKMPLLAKVKKALGPRLVLRGLSSFKKNAYFNLRYGFPGWVRPIAFEQYVPLYQRAKIGINVHNRGDHTVGGYRLFDLAGNGVMQISDGGDYLSAFYRIDDEIIGYRSADDLIDKVRHYLDNESERERIARAGFRRVSTDHRIDNRLRQLRDILNPAISSWKDSSAASNSNQRAVST